MSFVLVQREREWQNKIWELESSVRECFGVCFVSTGWG